MIWMPGASFKRSFQNLSLEEQQLKIQLEKDILQLSEVIGERHAGRPDKLNEARDYIKSRFKDAGYAVEEYSYTISGQEFSNLEGVLKGESSESLIIGAHYDSVPDCPAANDNASAVASMLALASALQGATLNKTIRFVAFSNEEMPHFMTQDQGSFRYLQVLLEQEISISGMISLETIGYYSDSPKTQHYPFPLGPFYPSRGNFIAFVSNMDSRKMLHEWIGAFRNQVEFPSEGAALPSWLPGVSWSDHAVFWKKNIPALMITDTAPFRYPYYHTPHDTVDKLDLEKLARVTAGLERTIIALLGK